MDIIDYKLSYHPLDVCLYYFCKSLFINLFSHLNPCKFKFRVEAGYESWDDRQNGTFKMKLV